MRNALQIVLLVVVAGAINTYVVRRFLPVAAPAK